MRTIFIRDLPINKESLTVRGIPVKNTHRGIHGIGQTYASSGGSGSTTTAKKFVLVRCVYCPIYESNTPFVIVSVEAPVIGGTIALNVPTIRSAFSVVMVTLPISGPPEAPHCSVPSAVTAASVICDGTP